MITDKVRREVAENLRYLADYPGAPVQYAEQLRDELYGAVFSDGLAHDCSELFTRLADLIEPSEPKVRCVAEVKVDGERLEELVHDAAVELTGVDRDALLALAEVLSTPELETDCGTCPLRKWCEEARDSGNRITCFECKLWHTADVIREALGIEP